MHLSGRAIIDFEQALPLYAVVDLVVVGWEGGGGVWSLDSMEPPFLAR